jgi:hypothetical protein
MQCGSYTDSNTFDADAGSVAPPAEADSTAVVVLTQAPSTPSDCPSTQPVESSDREVVTIGTMLTNEPCATTAAAEELPPALQRCQAVYQHHTAVEEGECSPSPREEGECSPTAPRAPPAAVADTTPPARPLGETASKAAPTNADKSVAASRGKRKVIVISDSDDSDNDHGHESNTETDGRRRANRRRRSAV